jgi:hypothetical protein
MAQGSQSLNVFNHYLGVVAMLPSIQPLQVASQKTLELGQVVLSTDNLFARCKQRSHIAHRPETNPLHQLDIIGNFIGDMAAIVKQHRAAPSQSSAAA